MLIYAILIMGGAGLILGVILGVASDKLEVKVDPLIEKITKLLPGYNCGGCGYPGCAGFAEGLVNGEVKTISTCRPSKPEQREVIKEAFDTTENANGEIVSVNI